MNIHTKYILYFTISFSAIFFLYVSFIYFVDPYDIWHSYKVESLNKNKPLTSKNNRIHKAKAVINRQPCAIVLGTSRSGYGINPDDSYMPCKNVYNLSLHGGNIYEILRYFQHSTKSPNLKHVILSLDFFAFNKNRKNNPNFDENILLVDRNGNSSSTFLSDLSYITSIDTFENALTTVFNQATQSLLQDNGLMSDKKKINQLNENGYAKYFKMVSDDFKNKHYLNFEFNFNGHESTYDYYRKILETSHDLNLDLKIYIPPVHTYMLDVIKSQQLWDKLIAWKKMLYDLNIEIAEDKGKQPFEIYDFMQVNELTDENIPQTTDIKMTYFYEASHHTQTFGHIILGCLYNKIDSQYCVKLKSSN